MKVCIITEGSAKLGFGHISRCTSLYQAFEEKKIIPNFIINGDDIASSMEVKNYIILDWAKNELALIKQIKNSEIAIVDSYLAGFPIYEKIVENVKLAVFIDDNMRINYPHGIVINGNVHALELNYYKSPGIEYLLGSQYSMLKKDFWDIPLRSVDNEIKTILITLGGSDLRNLTPKILKLLTDEFPEIFKKVIIGSSFKNIMEIENVADKSSELIYFPLTPRMKKEILASDIAITTGGQTVYELAALGVPTITIAVADNQLHNAKSFDKLGYNYYAGWWEDKNLITNIKERILDLKNSKTRNIMIEKGRNIIKPDGSRKIINYLIKKLKE